jgi:putative ABC transport system substrate-binding protein
MLLALGVIAEAQQKKKIYRIGVLSGLRPSPIPANIEALRKGLRELGYVEGQNIVVEYRWTEGRDDRFAPLAAELVSLGLDVIVTQGTQATVAAKQATSTIPIVVGGAGDLVGEGLVASLARPGGNVTGFTNIEPDLSAKRLQILKEALSRISRVAVLYHGGPGGDQEELRETQAAGKKLAVEIQPFHVLEPEQFQRAFTAMSKGRAEALIILQGTFVSSHRTEILERATKIKIPTISSSPRWPESGGLISYGHDPAEQWQRAAVYVDKVLKGTKPADLPVQQPMRFELVVNLKTAKLFGVIIEPNLLVRATKVIR